MDPTSSVAQYSFCLDVFFKRDTAECIGLAVKGATFLKIWFKYRKSETKKILFWCCFLDKNQDSTGFAKEGQFEITSVPRVSHAVCPHFVTASMRLPCFLNWIFPAKQLYVCTTLAALKSSKNCAVWCPLNCTRIMYAVCILGTAYAFMTTYNLTSLALNDM